MGRLLGFFFLVLIWGSLVFAKPFPVLVSVPPYEKIVSRISGDYATVHSLISAGSSDELFEPDVKMLRTLAASRVYFSLMTLPLEKGVLSRLKQLNPQLRVVSIALPEMQQDPHVWLSVRCIMRQVPLIVKGLSDFDPAHALTYQKNGERYLRYLKKLDEDLGKDLNSVRGRAFLIEHPTLSYFASDYGLLQLSLDAHEGKPVSPQALERVLLRVKQVRPKVIVMQPDTPQNRLAQFRTASVKPIWMDPLAREFDETLRRLSWQFKSQL